MKRFYKTASLGEANGGHTVLLDGRPVRTPAKQEMLIPSRPVAEAVAAEWLAQGEEIQPASMPLQRLVNTALDIVAVNRGQVVDNLAGYGDTDLLYYFAETPADLQQAQDEAWRPVLSWAERQFAVTLRTVAGIGYIAQDAGALAALRRAVEAHDDMELAALNDLVSITGSLLLGLAHSGAALPLDGLWRAARVDEDYQAGRWGWDSDAARQAERRRGEVEQAARFLALHRTGRPGAA